jgi:hypothetical protein
MVSRCQLMFGRCKMPVKANRDFYGYNFGYGFSFERCYAIIFDLTDKKTKQELILYIKNTATIGIRESKDWLALKGTTEYICDYRVVSVKEDDKLTLLYLWMHEWTEAIEEFTKRLSFEVKFRIVANDVFQGDKASFGMGNVSAGRA